MVGQDVATTLSYKDVIFVMEDVDAASKVVHRRGDPVTTSKTTHEIIKGDGPTQTVERVTRETSTNDAAVAASAANDAPPGPSSQQMQELLRAAGGAEGPTSSELNEGPPMKKEDAGAALLSKLLEVTDELNLAGLLNVVDGVVDTPERILIDEQPSREARPGARRRTDRQNHPPLVPAGGGGGADGGTLLPVSSL